MTNTFTNGTALPVTISQIQRLAQTLQKSLHLDSGRKREIREESAAKVVATPEPKIFSNRRGAGALLGAQLSLLAGRSDVTVVGIPQGGVIVASEVAKVLQAPLTTWITKKIQARLVFSATIGAVSEDGELLIDEEAYQRLHIPPTYLIDEVRACRAEVKRRVALYRDASPSTSLAGRTVVVVDDGLATGFTFRAALAGLRRQRPAKIILAVPAAPLSIARDIQAEIDEMVTLERSVSIPDMALRYVHFPKVESTEVVEILLQHRMAASTVPRFESDGLVGSFAH